MEVEQSFQTPATRRSPAQFEKTTETQLDLNEQKSKGRKGKGNNENMNEELKEKNNNNEKSNSHSIVTKAFEALKPYYRDGLSNNMAWLTDDVCEDAANNLGIVMPPIGYECTMRTFRSSKDVYKDPARDNGYNYDIYNKNDTVFDENDNAIHQGTISMTEENVDNKEDINIINEFGFGYRNGYVFNEKNDITPNGLLYIKHKSEKNLFDSSLNNNNNNDSSQNDNKSKPYYYYSDRRRRDDKVGGDDEHEYDSIKDVTAKTTGGRIRHNGGGFHHTHLRKNIHGAAMEISDGDDEEEEDNYDVIDNDNDNSGNGGFAFNKPLLNETQAQRQEAQEEEEDTKMNGNKPTRRSSTTVTTTKIGTSTTTRTRLPSSESSTKGGGWMSRYPIFGRTTDGGSSVNDGFNVAETPIQSPAPGRNSEENRRESLVSEYSNYTPDGIQRHANRRTLKN